MLTATSPEILAALAAWHEDGRASFYSYDYVPYDVARRKTAKDGSRWINLDSDRCGCYMVDKTSGDVWSIKAYGVPNRRLGTLAGFTAGHIKDHRYYR